MKYDALENSICHTRVTVSGIHDFNEVQSGFPIKIASEMTICESIMFDLFSSSFLVYTGEGTGVPAPVAAIVTGSRLVGDTLFFNIGKKLRAGCGSLGRTCPIILAAGELLFSSLICKPHGSHPL
jgi:hypothetical protein